MKNYVIGILSFLGGAALGGVVTWKVLEKKVDEKYKAIADEEIKSVKETFTVPKKEIRADLIEAGKLSDTDKDALKAAMNKPSLTQVAKEVTRMYTNYSGTPELERKQTTLPWEEGPQVIKPDDYGVKEDYDQIDLTLYADGILADDQDMIVDKGVVGDALDHMGEYDDDVVHVRDDERKRYYEILADERSYEDATGKEPPEDSKEE